MSVQIRMMQRTITERCFVTRCDGHGCAVAVAHDQPTVGDGLDALPASPRAPRGWLVVREEGSAREALHFRGLACLARYAAAETGKVLA